MLCRIKDHFRRVPKPTPGVAPRDSSADTRIFYPTIRPGSHEADGSYCSAILAYHDYLLDHSDWPMPCVLSRLDWKAMSTGRIRPSMCSNAMHTLVDPRKHPAVIVEMISITTSTTSSTASPCLASSTAQASRLTMSVQIWKQCQKRDPKKDSPYSTSSSPTCPTLGNGDHTSCLDFYIHLPGQRFLSLFR